MSDKVWFYCWNSTTQNEQLVAQSRRLCRRGLVKENKEKLYIYPICYVRERSFYKIHASEKLL